MDDKRNVKGKNRGRNKGSEDICVPVTRNSCRSSVYDILLKFENLSVIVTGRKRILSVTHEIVWDSG